VTERDMAELLRERALAHGVPGAVIGLLCDGDVLVARHGVANTQTGVPVTAESRFGVGSLTKSMVATVVARLAVEGQLSLDDPVTAHVPELRGATWAERATLRDLLANRSRLPLRVALEFDFAATEDDDAVLSRFAARVGAEEPTPVEWSYSNAGWSLLGRAIETATGSVWEDAMRSLLLEPAGMRESGFAASDARVAGHEGGAPVDPLAARALGPAGTSMVSTVGDMLRFAAIHLDDPSLALLREPQPSPSIHGWFDGWCLGWAWFEWNGTRAWGWDSVLSGERAALRLLPERRAAVVVMANGETGRPLQRDVFAELMGSLFGIAVPRLRLKAGTVGELARFAGVYAWPDRRVEVEAGETSLRIDDKEAQPVDEQTFLVDPTDPDNPTVTFWDDALYVMLWGVPRVSG
jgi:CubicO group peptidase (beta-lactamase class C family)